MLVDLDFDCGRHILTQWLSFECIPKVDSAHCNRSSRHQFLELLSGNGVPYNHAWGNWPYHPTLEIQANQWIALRGIAMKSLPLVHATQTSSALNSVAQRSSACVEELYIGQGLKVYVSLRLVA